ncbi:MAG: DUF6261 family protein [Tannerella sp.]|nr:DUF6261 family protein [Tannerella sp.]
MNETDFQIIQVGVSVLGLDLLYPVFAGYLGRLRQAYQVTAGNPLTHAKDQAEAFRDNRYGALSACVRSACYDTNPEIRQAAEAVHAVLEKAGNPSELSDSVETAELIALFEHLQPCAAQLEQIGALPRLQELEQANLNFVQIQDEWYRTGGQKPAGNVRTIRKEGDPTYHHVVNRVNALIEVNGPAEYQSFINIHNATIEQYKHILAQRKGRGKNDKLETVADATEL